MGKLAWRKSDKETFFSPKMDLEAAFNKRSDLREALLEVWIVDIHKAIKKFVKSDTSQLRGRRVRISPVTEWMTLDLVCGLSVLEDEVIFLSLCC